MARLSERAGKNRLAILVGLSATIAVSWLLMRGPSVELIDEETINANVLKVNHTTSGPTALDNKRMGVVLVELPDGGRARVFAPLSKVTVGGKITLKIKRFSDGSRRVIGANDKDGS